MKGESFKEKILLLREEGNSYSEISKLIGCSKATISYHCKRYNLQNIGLSTSKINEAVIDEIKIFYRTHTISETSEKFGISETTVKKYTSRKRLLITNDIERKKRNYVRVKSFRQRIKERAVEYKGGKCSICGYNNCYWALDFHHNNTTEKEFSIGDYVNKSWSNTIIELDKCILICSNCHRELHYNEYINNSKNI